LFYYISGVIIMDFKEKLAAIRKDRGMSQEELAQRIGVTRQAVSKWESGESLPDIDNLVAMGDILGVSIDRLIRRDTDGCAAAVIQKTKSDKDSIVAFLCKAKKNGYAAHAPEQQPSRPASHDIRYEDGDFLYIDSFLGGERFSGEEAVWASGKPVWAMNFSGRVLGQRFSGDFLKEALLNVSEELPFRGPLVHKSGDYSYHCNVSGGFEWFQGHEEIFCGSEKTYECYFHGGSVK
jgi:transcriptional regulator with XRE-family HTH domain